MFSFTSQQNTLKSQHVSNELVIKKFTLVS